MCPTCGTPLDMSDAPAANRIRAFIVRRIDGGDTRSEIMDELVAEFGPGDPRRPSDERVGTARLAASARRPGRRRRGRSGSTPGAGAARASPRRPRPVPRQNGRAPLDPELERRLEEELARFE